MNRVINKCYNNGLVGKTVWYVYNVITDGVVERKEVPFKVKHKKSIEQAKKNGKNLRFEFLGSYVLA